MTGRAMSGEEAQEFAVECARRLEVEVDDLVRADGVHPCAQGARGRAADGHAARGLRRRRRRGSSLIAWPSCAGGRIARDVEWHREDVEKIAAKCVVNTSVPAP